MKFLIFNLTVAAALFYLVTADRTEFQVAAGRVHDVAGEIKSMAERAVDKGRNMLGRSRPQPSPAAGIADATEKPPAAAPRSVGETPAEAPTMPPPETGTETGTEPPPAPKPALAKPAAPTPAASEPAVARRRDEILNGVEIDRQQLSLKDGARMMTPQQRRRELFSLAEEMELLYARTVSR